MYRHARRGNGSPSGAGSRLDAGPHRVSRERSVGRGPEGSAPFARSAPKTAARSRSFRGPFVSLDVLLSWSTDRAARRGQARGAQVGASGYSFWRLASHAADMMTGFSAWLLRLASVVGFGFTLFGLAVLAYVIVRYVVAGGSVPGFRSWPPSSRSSPGAQLFASGIIGEYLARMHFRSMEQPVYRGPSGRRRRDRPRTGLDRDPDKRSAPSEADSLRAPSDLLYGPLRAWFRGMPEDRRAEYWLDEIRSALSGPGAAALVARADGRDGEAWP